ncbi:hypothetical protein [Trinickia acidisoli]|uniref:hypothetical protein n=1 Tax=Trinickia acidisoli TaxID=2767482 RepID=UPI001A900AA9|nr:hypothetical protein [Trinickia acidisoli]
MTERLSIGALIHDAIQNLTESSRPLDDRTEVSPKPTASSPLLERLNRRRRLLRSQSEASELPAEQSQAGLNAWEGASFPGGPVGPARSSIARVTEAAPQGEPIAVMLRSDRLPGGQGTPLPPESRLAQRAFDARQAVRQHPTFQAIQAHISDTDLAQRLRKIVGALRGEAPHQITDPKTPEGEAWLRGEFDKLCASIDSPADRPSRKTLESVISGNLPPEGERSGSEVYWEHILLRLCGGDLLALDLERNYSKDLVFALTGEVNFNARGEQAIQTSAAWLTHLLKTTEYLVFDTVVRETGTEGTWVTERWAYRDPKIMHNQVTDGIDTFLIKREADGAIKIATKLINYTVDQVQPEDIFYARIGQPMPEKNEPPRWSRRLNFRGNPLFKFLSRAQE